MSPVGSAIVGIDSDKPLDVDWYCNGPGSMITASSGLLGPSAGPATLTALRALGTCRDAPAVTGTIVLDAMDGVELTLGSTTTHFASGTGGASVSPTQTDLAIEETLPSGSLAGAMALWFDGNGNLLAGMVQQTPLGPDPGAVYCVASGTSSGVADAFPTFSVSGLRRLGTCAEAKPAGACSEMDVEWAN